MRKLGVVVGVTEFVCERADTVGRTRPVQVHNAPAINQRSTERATTLAGAWLGIDPAIGDGLARKRCQRRRECAERMVNTRTAIGPRDLTT
jgi:hypothetical protein